MSNPRTTPLCQCNICSEAEGWGDEYSLRFQGPIPSSKTLGGKTDHVAIAISTPDLTQASGRQ